MQYSLLMLLVGVDRNSMVSYLRAWYVFQSENPLSPAIADVSVRLFY